MITRENSLTGAVTTTNTLGTDQGNVSTRRVLYFESGSEPRPATQYPNGSGWDIHKTSETKGALSMLRSGEFSAGVVVFDHHSVDELLANQRELFSAQTSFEWIALVSPDTLKRDDVRELITSRCYDFHRLPIDERRLLITLGRAHGMAALTRSLSRWRGDDTDASGLIGESKAVKTLRRTIAKVATVEAPVLITGESGTGKELTAQAIHKLSERKDAPFIAVNCGAISSSLIQSELFGHEKGAFTGAHKRKIGRIEAAGGGTLMLDEIGDLPLDLQTNLLRFLQEKTIERVGSSGSVHVDARIVAATNVDLEEAVSEGRFREDLYHRLNVLQVHVPILRQRDEDIERLAQFFFKQFSMENRAKVQGFSREALHVMNAHDWPGNVRELMNRVRRALVMTEGRLIKANDLGLDRRTLTRQSMSLDEARGRAEKHAIQNALQHACHNVTIAADKLEVSRVTLYRLMDKYHISRPTGINGCSV